MKSEIAPQWEWSVEGLRNDHKNILQLFDLSNIIHDFHPWFENGRTAGEKSRTEQETLKCVWCVSSNASGRPLTNSMVFPNSTWLANWISASLEYEMQEWFLVSVFRNQFVFIAIFHLFKQFQWASKGPWNNKKITIKKGPRQFRHSTKISFRFKFIYLHMVTNVVVGLQILNLKTSKAKKMIPQG